MKSHFLNANLDIVIPELGRSGADELKRIKNESK